MKNAHVTILAAGKGTRMKSDKPKVLSELNGKSLLEHLLQSVTNICEKPTIIVGHKGDEVIQATGNKFNYAWQHEQLGTGHAVSCTREALRNHEFEDIVVLPGDCPLVSSETINQVIAARRENDAMVSMVSMIAPHFEEEYQDFLAYGRVIRNENNDVTGIVEYKDASDAEKSVTELNAGIYCFNADWLWENIEALENTNNSGEFYITDLIKIAFDAGHSVAAVPVKKFYEAVGINTPEQLQMMSDILIENA